MSWSSQSGGKATHGGYDSAARHRLEEAFKCNLAVLARDLQSLTVTDLHFKKTYNVIKYLQSPQCKLGFCEFREENATSSFPVLHHPSLFNTTAGVSQTYMSKFWTSWAQPAGGRDVLGAARRGTSCVSDCFGQTVPEVAALALLIVSNSITSSPLRNFDRWLNVVLAAISHMCCMVNNMSV